MALTDEQLTANYLNSVLTGFKNINSVDIKMPKTHGAMSEVRRIILDYDESTAGICPYSVIVKRSSCREDNFLNMTDSFVCKVKEGADIMRHGQLYKIEVMLNRFFNNREFTPALYFSQIDDKQNYIMIMNDCVVDQKNKSAEDFNLVQNTINLYQISIAVRAIASIHAEFYHYNDKSRLDETKGILCGNYDEFMKTKQLEFIPEHYQFIFYTTNFMSFLDCPNAISFASYNNESLHFIGRVIDESWKANYEFLLTMDYGKYKGYNIPEIVKEISLNTTATIEQHWVNAFKLLTEEAPLTIIHGDFRADNFIIRDNKIKLFDWQCGSLGNGLFDVVSVLYNSFQVDDLFENEDKLIDLYVKTLQEHGCHYINAVDARKWYGLALWYEFKGALHSTKVLKSLTSDNKVNGIDIAELKSILLRKIVVAMHGIHKYYFSKNCLNMFL